ncbi:MAG: hypothetical protein U0936_12335 [Planctomycetaceae bacterium]
MLNAQRLSLLVLASLFCLTGSGCAGSSRFYSKLTPRHELRESRPPIAFRYGKPNWCLDNMQKLVELPSRVMLGGRLRADRVPSEETREVLADYLQENDLSDIPVLVNDYDPAGQWQRLRENDRISPAWKYTAGMVGLFNYTVFPGRVFARDTYSPFTNTLHVNTGRLSDSLHGAAYAKDIRTRKAPGTYAVVNSLPGLALWKTTIAVHDVVAYAQAKDSWQLESGVYRDQYPQVAVKTMAPVGLFMTPVGNVALAVSGGAVGYAVGRTIEQQRIAERDAIRHAEEDLSGRAESDSSEDSGADDSEDPETEYGS